MRPGAKRPGQRRYQTQLAWQEVHRERTATACARIPDPAGPIISKKAVIWPRNDLLAAREMASQDYSEQQVTEAITDGSPELAEPARGPGR